MQKLMSTVVIFASLQDSTPPLYFVVI